MLCYKVNFPKSYITFLKKYNGAIPINCVFFFNEHEYLVERFLSFLGDKINEIEAGWTDIEVIVTQLDERLVSDGDILGMDIIPIAVLFAGDYICLDFRNNKVDPEVCIWDHEQSAPFQPVTKKIANCFNDFLDILK